MLKQFLVTLVLAASLLSLTANANEQGAQFKQLGDLEVHYIAFPSTVLKPVIAKQYGLTRSGKNAIINISALDTRYPEKPAREVTITGFARNLLGNKTPLNFKQVTDGDAIYYLSELAYENQETFQFELTVTHKKSTHTLRFKNKFYVD